MPASARPTCRVCESSQLIPWLDLGEQPPANAFRKPGEPPPPSYPLVVNRCEVCHHNQLSVRVDPEELYTGYVYRSGISKTFATHCDELAELALRLNSTASKVLDIGCNDGPILKAFGRAGLSPHGLVGVDPTSDADVPYPIIRGYFPDVDLPHGGYDVIVTQNTFNAIDYPRPFVARIAELLTWRGAWIIEVPYLVTLIRGLAADSVYAEHQHYWLIGPLMHLLEPHGLQIVAIYRRAMHAGSLRIVIAKEKRAEIGRDWAWWEEVAGYHDASAYARFNRDLGIAVLKFKAFREKHKGRWAGVGAAAKMTVFCKLFGLTPDDIPIVADETPQKQGKISPTGIRVVTPEELTAYRPDYVLCFAWNFWTEILPKARKWEPGATFVVPLPEVTAHR